MNSTRQPGKFEGCDDQTLGEQLYALAMDGCDEELGEVCDFGWYGLILSDDKADPRSYIVSEDGQGFFEYTEFETPNAAREAWAKIEAEYEEFTSLDEETNE